MNNRQLCVKFTQSMTNYMIIVHVRDLEQQVYNDYCRYFDDPLLTMCMVGPSWVAELVSTVKS